jgi:hypothetical protein
MKNTLSTRLTALLLGHTTPADQGELIETELSVHIFTVSANLVGVCLAVIGIFRAIDKLTNFGTIADNLLALDAFTFLVSGFLAYLSLRAKIRVRRRRFERWADVALLVGLVLMVAVCGLVAYELI